MTRLGAAAAALILASAMAAGCATRAGVRHPVAPGESAFRIAEAYGVDLVDLLEANEIPDPALIRPGHVLLIPGASALRSVPREPAGGSGYAALERRRFRIPVRGKVSSGFGGRGGRRHQGVDILAPEGTEVGAAEAGIVLYAGDALRGYGNMIVIDHGEGVTTLYGHLKDFRVESGDVVAPGAVVGTVGDTGNATTTHLHFELRYGNEAVDPFRFMGRMDADR